MITGSVVTQLPPPLACRTTMRPCDVLDSQPERFAQSETRSVQEPRDEAGSPLEFREHEADLVTREHHRK